MLSRRDKLLVQPWNQRRFNEHRSKVQLALPAIDDRPPGEHPHVITKLKKCQKEMDRKNKIQSDNFSLLQRLNAIMKVNRLDNRWTKPLPNIHQKVGMFYDESSLRSRLTAHTNASTASEDTCYGRVKCFACEKKQKTTTNAPRRAYSLPSIDCKNIN